MADRKLLLRCRAGCFHFLELSEWDYKKDGTMFITVTAGEKTLWKRLQAVWQALKGARYQAGEEILLYKEDVKKLKKWLEKT